MFAFDQKSRSPAAQRAASKPAPEPESKAPPVNQSDLLHAMKSRAMGTDPWGSAGAVDARSPAAPYGAARLARSAFAHLAASSVSQVPQVQRACNQCDEEAQTLRRETVQREAEEEDEEKARLTVQRAQNADDEDVRLTVQRELKGEGRLARPSLVQAKLAVSSPGDPFEQEAEQVAQEVAAFHASFGASEVEASLLSRVSVPRVMGLTGVGQRSFRSARSTGRKLRIFPNSERQTSREPNTVAPDTESRIMQSRGIGQPLPRHVHNLMSLRTGYDFSDVRVKTGPEAAALNESLHARAFTLGPDIWLGKDESPDDVRLMAHEVTHVAQQGAARPVSRASLAGIDGLKDKSVVRSYLQALSRGTSHDASLYKKEIDQFRARNPSDQIEELHRQILERPAGRGITRESDSKTVRTCGGGGGGGGRAPCAVPTNFRETARSRAAGGVLHFEYAWDSSTGNLADLSSCEVGERVDYTQTEDPPFRAAPNPTILWVPGRDGRAEDNHSPGTRRPYKESTERAVQMYRYHCPCSNGDAPVNLMGPINLTRRVIAKEDGNFRYTITKSGLDNAIDPLP